MRSSRGPCRYWKCPARAASFRRDSVHHRRAANLRAQGALIAAGRSTFRGPLLPAKRRNPKLPRSLRAFGGFAVIAVAHEIETRYAEALQETGISLRDFVVLAELKQRPGS